MRFRILFGLGVSSLALFAIACSADDTITHRQKGEVYQEDPSTTILPDPDKPEDGGVDIGSSKPSTPDAAVRTRSPDAGPLVACTGSLKAGDLVVTEVMIASKTGSNDEGEWVEIMNARECILTVTGVKVESPRGDTTVDSVTITEKLVLQPFDTFVVADSSDAAKNHNIPGKVYSWAKIDTLKNSGDQIRVLSENGTVIEDFTFPQFKTDQVPNGASVAFPDSCNLANRYNATSTSAWVKYWGASISTYATGFKGTPNAPNIDIGCPL